jgi:hypothetical protein
MCISVLSICDNGVICGYNNNNNNKKTEAVINFLTSESYHDKYTEQKMTYDFNISFIKHHSANLTSFDWLFYFVLNKNIYSSIKSLNKKMAENDL